jgi:uncharacterized protein YllA (UPF0747 family)
MVEDLSLNEEHRDVIRAFWQQLSLEQSPWAAALTETSSYSEAMLRLLVYLFRGTGLLFVEPKLLRPLAVPFFERELAESEHILRTLKETTQRLKEAGGNPVIVFGEGTNLFYKDDHLRRVKIPLEGREKFLQSPERLSTNVAARAVLQSVLFPTLAYISGPGEMAYYPQLRDYYALHGVPMPWIVPRVSMTFVTPEAQHVLEKLGLQAWDQLPTRWEDCMQQQLVGMDQLANLWKRSATDVLDHRIASSIVEREVAQAIQRLSDKAIKHHLDTIGIPSHGLHLLHNLLHPHEKLQERVLSWWNFQALTSENLVLTLLQLIDWRAKGHHYVYLNSSNL